MGKQDAVLLLWSLFQSLWAADQEECVGCRWLQDPKEEEEKENKRPCPQKPA